MEDNKENIQQQPAEGKNKGIKTPEPPQRKDPRDRPVSDAEGKADEDNSSEYAPEKKSAQQQPQAGKQPAADRSTERQGPPAPGESEKDVPTTTTNRNSY